MKLDLDEQIGPILGVLAGNIVVAPVAGLILGEWGILTLFPGPYLAARIGLDIGGHGELAILGLFVIQGVIYSVILGIGLSRDRLRRTAVWLFWAHGVAAVAAIIWRVLAP